MRRISGILVATLLALSMRVSAESPESAAMTIAAQELLAKGKVESAELMFYRALTLDAQNGVALHEVGKLLLRRGDKSIASDFMRRAELALKNDPSQASRYKELVSSTKQNFPQTTLLREALEEYRNTIERIVNANNNELVREVSQEKLGALGLEIKITAREQHLLSFASVELTQSLDTPIGSLREGASFLMNFDQAYFGVPGIWNNLKYNKVRFGESQSPSVKVLKSGKVLIMFGTKDATTAKELGEFCKQLKAEKSKFQISAGDQNFEIHVWEATEGKVVNFKAQVVVCAAEMVLKVKR